MFRVPAVSRVVSTVLAFNVNTDSVTLFTEINNNVFAGTTSINTSLINGIRTNVPRSSPEGPTYVTSGINSGMNSITNVNTSLCRSCINSIVSYNTLTITTNFNLDNIVLPVLVTTLKVLYSVISAFFISAGRNTDRGVLLNSLEGNACATSVLSTVTDFTMV